MNEQILAIADKIQKEYGLDHYILKRNHIFSEINLDNKTRYVLSLEWFPQDRAENEDKDFNPDGSAVIDVDLHTSELRRIIFVNNISFAQEGNLPSPDMEAVIEWVEDVTGMMFGRQFKLIEESGHEYRFQATVDNIEVAPTGSIEVLFNEEDKLTQFTVDGIFPTEDQIEWEPFSLTKENDLDAIKEYFTIVETPIEEEEKWLKAWHVKQIFIRNDNSEIIQPEDIYNLSTYKDMNITLKWEAPCKRDFTPQDIDLSTEISFDDAMKKETVTPISEEEVKNCLEETNEFISSQFPDHSGIWTVTGMYPEKDYIFTELKGEKFKAFQRKIKLIINRDNYRTINYWDNKFVLDMYNSYKESEETAFTKEEAFEKIINNIEITPVYIKDLASNRYILCGRVDCDVVIDGVTGEKININEL